MSSILTHREGFKEAEEKRKKKKWRRKEEGQKKGKKMGGKTRMTIFPLSTLSTKCRRTKEKKAFYF